LQAYGNGVTAAQVRAVAAKPGWTVTLKDGSRFEIEASSEEEARRVVRERLSVARVPAGTVFAKTG
jgi:hypothetical protein